VESDGLVSKAKKECAAMVYKVFSRQICDKMDKHCVNVMTNPKHDSKRVSASVDDFLKVKITLLGAWKCR